jgi:hypothetical protein
MLDKRAYGIMAVAALWLSPAFVAGRTFIPDAAFKGSTLKGWHVLGQADWHATNGEIVGTAKAGGGGWLVLDHSYQDVGLFANFRCTGGCRTGVLLRAEKTADGGMRGIFVSLDQGEVASYRVTLGADGQELQREELRHISGNVRIAPPPNPDAAAGRGRGGRGRGNVAPNPNVPIQAPERGLHAGEWNQVEIFLDANVIKVFLNHDQETAGGVAEEEYGRYGPLALYVGGTGEVRFKDVAYKDVAIRLAPQEKISSRFRMQRLSEFYYGWSAAAADFNHDGILDIVAGPYIYFGPDYTKSREIFMSHTWNPSREFANDCMVQGAADMTGDGWPDVICSNLGTPVYLYVNPKGESRRWDKYQVVPRIENEIIDLKDIDGDGKPELLYVGDRTLRYAKPDPANPTGPWVVHNISEPGLVTGHGIGSGDINGDGRVDVVNAYGWFENPGPGGKEPWAFHPQVFGTWSRCCGVGGALMGVYDVNGDGLNDVVTSQEAHNFGLAWYEQKRDAAGKISFVEHVIAGDYTAKNPGGVTFSQPHGATFADVDGDGVPDFIVGKRYWSHEDDWYDADPYGPPVLYWYRTVRNPKAPGGAEFVPELIHNRSGAGSEILAVDLNKDGAIDIVTSTDRGTFIFWGKPHTAGAQKPAAAAQKPAEPAHK